MNRCRTWKHDLEQLELYLDGALERAERSVLESRLKSDITLNSTLTELKAQRALRSAVWQSNEPDKVTADQLVWRVRGAMLQQKQEKAAEIKPNPSPSYKTGWSQWKFASVGSAAAACPGDGFHVWSHWTATQRGDFKASWIHI